MMGKKAVAGNSGPKVRSDCEILLETAEEGGVVIDLESKVKFLYGESILKLIPSVLGFYKIFNARVRINDSGALPFVICARLEAAVRQLISTDLEYLPDFLPQNGYTTERERLRISRLYLPGNSPSLMINAGLHSADGIILDLEDSVAPEKKAEARILVRNALRQVDFYGAERMVRINRGSSGIEDLRFVVPHNVNLIILPKSETAESVIKVNEEIERLKSVHRIRSEIHLMPVIESALGVENSFEIAGACGNVAAIAIGLEDFTADLGVARTMEGTESLYARSRIIIAARAAGIQPIDSVFSDVGDIEGLRKTVIASKSLGFEGMGCIHPGQVKVIRNGFAPGPEEIEKAREIVAVFEDAKRNGQGVVALGTRMIDPPVVARAQRTIDLAKRLGLAGVYSEEDDSGSQTDQ